MQVIHNLGALSIKKDVDENVGFMLANKRGSYCSFFNAASSRYNGLFYFDEKTMSMHKFIESIEIIGDNNVISLKNGFYFAERRKNEAVESFLMPKNFNSLIYELSSNSEINLILDCKNSYDNREWGRYYDISEEKDCIIIKFTKKTDAREDLSNGVEEYVLYLIVKSNNQPYQKNDKWFERNYSYDEERKSPPFKRYVYNALRLKGSKFVFSMSKNKNDATKECEHLFNNINEIKNKERECFFEIVKNKHVKEIMQNNEISKEIRIAYVNSINSLNNLAVDGQSNYGIFAGLPWFFQFWSRDALISLKSLFKINEKLAKKIFFKCLNKINNEGRLPNLVGQHKSIILGNADAHGWLFFRCNPLAEKINKNKEIINSIKASIKILRANKNSNGQRIRDYMRKCDLIISKKENERHRIFYEMESSLEKSLNGLSKFHTKDNFEVNDPKETWMDTKFEDDCRGGARIEMQALRLNMYKLMLEMTQNQKYKVLENLLKIKVREKFWNGRILADGLNDFTIRPNIFIAAYVYPDLLANEEWETCFGNALKNLWLGWGGLSTIDKNDKLFTDMSTGEDIKSYHRGDSWFWINNLAAIALNNINNKKFQKNIQKIIEASAEEILWKGCVGCHSELSSARELRSEGCWSQAWSSAMYIEMIDEVFG